MIEIETGIYKIQSKSIPERMYIGSSKNIHYRKLTHLAHLRNGWHNHRLQPHFNMYGESDLEFSVIELCDVSLLKTREQYYISKLRPFFNFRNVNNTDLHKREDLQDVRDYCKKIYNWS
jgi:group I intron endonuclease